MIYPQLSKLVLDAAFEVSTVLGPGLLEAPYHNALYYALAKRGCGVVYNAPFNVAFEGHTVGEYYADLLVDGRVILEIKSVTELGKEHYLQLLNYLHISGCKLGFLLNFRPYHLEFKRLVLEPVGG